KRYAFADPLKQMYAEMKGISLLKLEAEKDKHRPGLVALGHGMRGIDPDVWVNGVFNSRSGIYDSMVSDGVVITDTRYVNEASFGRKHAHRLGVPFRLIWVARAGVGPANDMERSFSSLLRSMADVILINDMKVNTPVGKVATEMAMVYAMSVIPNGGNIE